MSFLPVLTSSLTEAGFNIQFKTSEKGSVSSTIKYYLFVLVTRGFATTGLLKMNQNINDMILRCVPIMTGQFAIICK